MSVKALEALRQRGCPDLEYLLAGLGNDERIPRTISGIVAHVKKYNKSTCRLYAQNLGSEISLQHFHTLTEEYAQLKVEVDTLKKNEKAYVLQIQKLKESKAKFINS